MLQRAFRVRQQFVTKTHNKVKLLMGRYWGGLSFIFAWSRSRAVVAMLLDGWVGKIGELPAWMIREVDPADLEAFLRRLRIVLVEQALPEE